MNQDEKPGINKKTIMIVVAAIAMLLLIVILFVHRLRVDNATMTSPEETAENSEPKDEKMTQSSGKNEKVSEEQTVDEKQDKITKAISKMICVPFDEMHLRESPNSYAEELEVLKTGSVVEVKGTMREENGFLYVKDPSTGVTGYGMADCLVPIYYDYDDQKLDIVDISDSEYSYEEFSQDVEEISKRYADCVSVEIIGKSVDKRDIYCLYVGAEDAPHHILIQGSIHAREYMNSMLLMRLIEYYASSYEDGSIDDKPYKELFSQVQLVIVPMVNPDGVTIVQTGLKEINTPLVKSVINSCYERDKIFLIKQKDYLGEEYWDDHYKDESFDRMDYPDADMISFDEYLRQWKGNAYGVDLNNNFDGNWSELDLKDDRSYCSYKGKRYESEPESYALAELARKEDYVCSLSYHSKGEIIYYDTKDNSPEVSQSSQELATLVNSQIKYSLVSNVTSKSVNQGGFGDWMQLELGTPSVTIESGRYRCPLSIEEFMPMWYRHRELWAVLMNNIVKDGEK